MGRRETTDPGRGPGAPIGEAFFEGEKVGDVRDIRSGAWEFDDDVAAIFEEMLERSVPSYRTMRGLVTELASSFIPRGVPRGGLVVDLGASRGSGLEPIIDQAGVHAKYVAVETAPAMLAELRRRWPPTPTIAPGVRPHGVDVVDFDLRRPLAELGSYPPADVTLLVLTLQFVPIEHRQRLLADVYEQTKPGGALILVEKVLGNSPATDRLFVDHYERLKMIDGDYSPEEVARKRLELEGVLVPIKAEWNEELLRTAGFRLVDVFYRVLNFAGWIAVRD